MVRKQHQLMLNMLSIPDHQSLLNLMIQTLNRLSVITVGSTVTNEVLDVFRKTGRVSRS